MARFRHVRRLAAGVLVAGCVHRPQAEQSLARRAVETLGSRDGYVFVFSPFNCSLQQDQIDALNAIAARTRRSGIILTIGPRELGDSLSASAVAKLGLTMRSRVLSQSPLRGLVDSDRMATPLAIAIRNGRIIGIIAGDNAERVDTWIEWLEQSRMPAVSNPEA